MTFTLYKLVGEESADSQMRPDKKIYTNLQMAELLWNWA